MDGAGGKPIQRISDTEIEQWIGDIEIEQRIGDSKMN